MGVDSFKNKKEIIMSLQEDMISLDDDVVWVKEKIRNVLMNCPELLYAIHNEKLESELFNSDGSLNTEGEWDRYFGENSNIRPYVFFPDTQDIEKNYIGYKVEFDNVVDRNAVEKYCQISFYIFVSKNDSIDKKTGIPRHDLLATILRRRFNWSNVFGTQCVLISSKETATDNNNYIERTILFEAKMLNSITRTKNGDVQVINKTGAFYD